MINIIQHPLAFNEGYFTRQLSRHPALLQAIKEYKQNLEEQDIEIFKQVDNLLITEKGYFIALWS